MIWKPLDTVRVRPKDVTRFWFKVDIKGEDDCWLWKELVVDGYGQFRMDNSNHRSNRLAYFLATGVDPKGWQVCHRCDIPLCCNPKHLFLGTGEDNQRDCAIKGRKPSRITPDIVREIRQICIPNDKEFSYSALGRRYGINPGVIWNVFNGKRWKHVQDSADKP